MTFDDFDHARPDDLPRLRAGAESLCRELAAPDLDDFPLYIIFQSEVDGGEFDTPGCRLYGFVENDLDLAFREAIGDRWAGRGPAIMLADVELAHDCDPLVWGMVCLATIIHELAHVLELWTGTMPAAPPEATIANKRELVRYALQVARDDSAARIAPPWFLHESAFIRACCHLAHRLQRRGFPVKAGALCAGFGYGLAPAFRYVEALDAEPQRLGDEPISSILKTPPPPAFVELFAADVAHFTARKESR